MRWCSFGSVEGLTAGAGVLGVGVIDREALTLNRVSEVDRGTTQVGTLMRSTTTSTPSKERIASPSSVRSSKYSW